MKLRYKILNGFLILIGVAVVALGLVLSRDDACEPIPAAEGEGFSAIAYNCYGDASVLQLVTLPKPVPAEDELLVRVHAAGVNPLDYHYMRGMPYIMRLSSGLGAPDETRLGVDFSGTVEAVGAGVTRFQPGDAIFGGWTGAFAEYLTIPEDRSIAPKPDNVSFEEAATVPIAAITALQALRDHGQLQPGQRVLINGASGGVGTFAVQIAKAMGGEVTGVCSTRNVEMVRSIGADHVIDYKQDDYTRLDARYDLIVDMVGNHSPAANVEMLEPGGTYVIVGGPKGNWIAPLVNPIKAAVLSPFVDEKIVTMLARLTPEDMVYLSELMAEGKMKPVLDREFGLSEVPDAIRYSESQRARGKIVVTMD
jgi:NADPH:quinone reductase-like Zn-dependent oxidoreductase